MKASQFSIRWRHHSLVVLPDDTSADAAPVCKSGHRADSTRYRTANPSAITSNGPQKLSKKFASTGLLCCKKSKACQIPSNHQTAPNTACCDEDGLHGIM